MGALPALEGVPGRTARHLPLSRPSADPPSGAHLPAFGYQRPQTAIWTLVPEPLGVRAVLRRRGHADWQPGTEARANADHRGGFPEEARAGARDGVRPSVISA